MDMAGGKTGHRYRQHRQRPRWGNKSKHKTLTTNYQNKTGSENLNQMWKCRHVNELNTGESTQAHQARDTEEIN